MDNKNIKSILHDALEDQIPASQINLLPVVQARLVARNKPIFQQGENMNKLRIKRLAFSVLTIIALLAVALITPQGRAFAQSVLHLFKRAESNTLPLQPWQIVFTPSETNANPYPLSLEEVAKLTGYQILIPSQEALTGYLFKGTTYDPKNNMVSLFYAKDTGEGEGFMLNEQKLGAPEDIYPLQGVVGVSAPIETINIGSFQGEYIEGVWKLTEKGPVWSSEPFLKTLRWKTDTLFVEMVYGGIEMMKDDLVAFAESMK